MNITLPSKLTLGLKNFSGVRFLQLARRGSRYLLTLLFLGAIAWTVYFWYSSVYEYSWNEQQKSSYRNEYSGQTSFRTERFNHTVNVLEERLRLQQTNPTVKRDIFLGTSL